MATGSNASSETSDLKGVAKRALWTALVAAGLFGPFIGLLTQQNMRNQLVLTTRPALFVTLVLAVVAIRLFVDLPVRWRGYLAAGAGAVLIVVAIAYLFSGGDPAITRPLAEIYGVVGGLLLLTGLSYSVYRGAAGRAGAVAAKIAGSNTFASLMLGALVAFPLATLYFKGAGASIKWVDNFGIQILIYVMLGWGLNIVVGLAGLLDLGYVAFYAVGAYSYALLAKEFGLSFWILLPLAGILAAFWGIILGFPVLRLRGDYLAIVTLAFGEIIRLVLINWVDFSNGYAGISGIPRPTFFGIPFNASETGFAAQISNFVRWVAVHLGAPPDSYWATYTLPFSPIYRTIFLYYVILCLALLTAYVTIRLRRMPVGRAWEALREDEIACRSLGINTTNTKLTAFSLGAMFGGFAGAFFAARQGFISPESFTFIESAQILAIVVLGGMGSLYGVVIAAIALVGGFELMRELDFLKLLFGPDFDPTQYRTLLFGAAMVLIMLWKPRGLISTREPTAFLKERKAVSGSHVQEGHG
jgi:branched-chain amino acid transport system permease protein